MNLRVDLILETEQRSGSFVTNKGALRILSIVLPVVLIGAIGWSWMKNHRLKKDIAEMKLRYESLQPQQQKALTISARFQSNRALKSELDGWRDSRLNWSGQLHALMTVVPTNVQFSALGCSQTLQLTNDKPARTFTLNLRGKALGTSAESAVKALETALGSSPAFSNYTTGVSVPVYAANTEPGANRDDRVFQIVCPYAQRTFP